MGKNQIKTIVRFGLILIMSCFGVVGCQSRQKPQNNKQGLEVLPRGVRYPPLLSPENAHSVTLNLRAVPSYLSSNDLKEVVYIIGRVPGLSAYEIRLIKDSLLVPGMIEVYLQTNFVIMEKKDMHWRVYTIQGYSP